MTTKEILVAGRVRHLPRSDWSWLDRRFLREYSSQLSGDAVFLYLCLSAVGDKHGLSYYSDTSLALQIDWGVCGPLKIGTTTRRVSVFVAVLCYSRMCFIEFTLSQRKAEFYRALVHALEFFGGTPRKIVFDNLKAAVLSGSGRTARLHPEFEALCGLTWLASPSSSALLPSKCGFIAKVS